MNIYSTELQNLITKTILENNIHFNPTYLYIKQHTITGKLYFGKTQETDVINYPGSGKYWKRHITKHGKEYVDTVWYCLFNNIEDIIEMSLMICEMYNIGWNYPFDDNWLNLIPENGIDGVPKGTKVSEERKLQISIANTGRIQSKESNLKRSIALKGKRKPIRTPEHIAKLADAMQGVNKGMIRGSQSQEHKDKAVASRARTKLLKSKIQSE